MGRPMKHDMQKVRALYEEGLTWDQIMQQCGIKSRKTLRDIILKTGASRRGVVLTERNIKLPTLTLPIPIADYLESLDKVLLAELITDAARRRILRAENAADTSRQEILRAETGAAVEKVQILRAENVADASKGEILRAESAVPTGNKNSRIANLRVEDSGEKFCAQNGDLQVFDVKLYTRDGLVDNTTLNSVADPDLLRDILITMYYGQYPYLSAECQSESNYFAFVVFG